MNEQEQKEGQDDSSDGGATFAAFFFAMPIAAWLAAIAMHFIKETWIALPAIFTIACGSLWLWFGISCWLEKKIK